jgi:hypothetical protein
MVFGHDVNECSFDGNFPLAFASKRGCDGRVLKLLVAHRNIQINQRNETGETALWLAASSGNIKVMGVVCVCVCLSVLLPAVCRVVVLALDCIVQWCYADVCRIVQC